MQICQGETLNHQGVITHEVCCLAAQLKLNNCPYSSMPTNIHMYYLSGALGPGRAGHGRADQIYSLKCVKNVHKLGNNA